MASDEVWADYMRRKTLNPNGYGKKNNPRGDIVGDSCQITFEKHRKIQICLQNMEIGNRIAFKVVRTCESRRVCEWRVYVYSSERGTWTFKRLLSSIPLHHPPVNLNGMLYLCKKGSYRTGPGVLIAHDFYGPEADDQCPVIPLPPEYNMISCLTTSRGDVIYIEILDQRLKVWRLNSERWQLSREEIDMASVGFDVDCIPMAMNPFDSDIIYLWSLEHCCFVSGNLRTHEFIVHQESENWSSSKGCCRINTSGAEGYMEYARYLFSVVMLSQFVLPQWMDPVPRPPN
ncbi:unnamed protein product [Arabis nemorensis]|uniref:F-box protein At3g26010-like beta-propeller domain-containing protein n=1 Tax=Arabis nemorensis TaxID=586526 RepID=A0A565BIM5_9BRAS|nr:unnamed protein product [Arabis nemorensis]